MSDGGTRGKVPPGWAAATVGEVAEVDGGLTKNGARRAESQNRVPLVSVAALRDGYVDFGEVSEIGLLPEDGDRGRLMRGDLLIVEGNGSLDQIGRSALWPGHAVDVRHQNHLIRVRSSVLGTDYIRHWLTSSAGRAATVSKAVSGAGLYSLSIGKVGALELPIAPLAEQWRIVAKLDDLLARSHRAKEALAEIPALLERHRRAVLAAAFRGELTADWRASRTTRELALPEVSQTSACRRPSTSA